MCHHHIFFGTIGKWDKIIYWYIISYHSNKCKVIDLGHGCAEGVGDDFQKIYKRKEKVVALGA